MSLLYQQDLAPGSVHPRHLDVTLTQDLGDLYYSDGSDFVKFPIGQEGQILMVVNGIPSWQSLPNTGLAANRPTAGTFIGQQYFSSNTHTLNIWDGTVWRTQVFT